MKTLITLITALILSACSTFTAKPQTLHATAFFATYKLLDNSSAAARPVRIEQLRQASAALATAADGSVSRDEIAALLAAQFQGDPDLTALSFLILSFMPDTVASGPAVSDLARNAALGINAALPAK